MADQAPAAPRANLSLRDVAIMVVGIVLGVGIFKTPSLVANFSSGETMFLGLWLLGGLVTLVHRFKLLAFGWDAQHDRILDGLLRMGIDGLYCDHVDRMVEAQGRDAARRA